MFTGYIYIFSDILALVRNDPFGFALVIEHWVQARIFYQRFLCFQCRYSISCNGKVKIDIKNQLFKLMNLTRSVKV